MYTARSGKSAGSSGVVTHHQAQPHNQAQQLGVPTPNNSQQSNYWIDSQLVTSFHSAKRKDRCQKLKYEKCSDIQLPENSEQNPIFRKPLYQVQLSGFHPDVVVSNNIPLPLWPATTAKALSSNWQMKTRPFHLLARQARKRCYEKVVDAGALLGFLQRLEKRYVNFPSLFHSREHIKPNIELSVVWETYKHRKFPNKLLQFVKPLNPQRVSDLKTRLKRRFQPLLQEALFFQYISLKEFPGGYTHFEAHSFTLWFETQVFSPRGSLPIVGQVESIDAINTQAFGSTQQLLLHFLSQHHFEAHLDTTALSLVYLWFKAEALKNTAKDNFWQAAFENSEEIFFKKILHTLHQTNPNDILIKFWTASSKQLDTHDQISQIHE
ncbi:hypothetical protein O181_017932 [Austropuccinia psidii MF-1]|uniref:Uncharacterized protein n=1 Tax=Austropuccinia psidii MF-1 TaxID=1389203 RepID=A0A9Q3C8K2_9BASI|nr:hypothetical protein [Austropuccinia psidii MF-1]